jgi:cytochrome oxidase Cu insertion factor (SCO1/SenC/PrrC family)
MRRGFRRFALAALVPALLFVIGAGAGTTPQDRGEIGFKVTEFSLTTYDGETFTEKNLADKVTLLVFWYPT